MGDMMDSEGELDEFLKELHDGEVIDFSSTGIVRSIK